MAAKSVDLMTEKLIDIREVFNRIDPVEFSEVMEPALLDMMHSIVNDVMQVHLRDIWETLPEEVREEVVIKSIEESPAFLSNLMQDIRDHIEDVFDIKDMVVTQFTHRKELLNKVFLECGKDEFIFIERSGFYFGFIFGLIQAILWCFYKGNWVLPTMGFIVGYATNAIALKIIFEPIQPKYICGKRFQGLFLQRQYDVSHIFAEITAKDVLNSHSMWDAILHGPKKDKFNELLHKHTHDFIEDLCGGLKSFVVMYLGSSNFYQLKTDIAALISLELPRIIETSFDYTEETFKIEDTMRTVL